MPKFKFNSKASVYKPVEMEFEGQHFLVRNLDHAGMKKLNEYDQKVEENASAQYERLEWLLNQKSPSKVIRALPMAVCNDAVRFVINSIMFPEKEMEAAEKNVKGPGKKE